MRQLNNKAMMCNCPIVSTDVGDVNWVIGKTKGCYITSFNPVYVAEKIKLALNFSETIIKTKGRERIVDICLTSQSTSNQIINIYKTVLKQSKRHDQFYKTK